MKPLGRSILNFELDEKYLRTYESWFGRYIETFNFPDPEVRRNFLVKVEHTRRVRSETTALGRSLRLSAGALRLAEAVALFHDVGRFPQFRRYRTLLDARSEDHASLGVKVIKKEEVLASLSPEIRRVILCGVMLHSRAVLPVRLPAPCLQVARMIRDADKLDIYQVMIDTYTGMGDTAEDPVVLNLPDRPEVSAPVLDALFNRSIIRFSHLKTLSDLKILNFSYVFDVNFLHSFREIKRRGYLETILQTLPDREMYREAYAVVTSYVEEKLKNGGP